jgi:hypothetical protein
LQKKQLKQKKHFKHAEQKKQIKRKKHFKQIPRQQISLGRNLIKQKKAKSAKARQKSGPDVWRE